MAADLKFTKQWKQIDKSSIVEYGKPADNRNYIWQCEYDTENQCASWCLSDIVCCISNKKKRGSAAHFVHRQKMALARDSPSVRLIQNIPFAYTVCLFLALFGLFYGNHIICSCALNGKMLSGASVGDWDIYMDIYLFSRNPKENHIYYDDLNP